MIDKGQWWEFGQDNGVTPLLFTRSAMGLLVNIVNIDLLCVPLLLPLLAGCNRCIWGTNIIIIISIIKK